MSTIALSPTSYLVLGCLATGGPSTPYELKQAVTASIGYFWSFPHSQLYSEPARLAGAGLLTEQREQGGRRRRVFAITEPGRQALRAWLADTTATLPDIRDIGLLKLFFGALTEQDNLVALAHGNVRPISAGWHSTKPLVPSSPPGRPAPRCGSGLPTKAPRQHFGTRSPNTPRHNVEDGGERGAR